MPKGSSEASTPKKTKPQHTKKPSTTKSPTKRGSPAESDGRDNPRNSIGSITLHDFYLQDEIDLFRQVFRQYDGDRRGYITSHAVLEVLKELGLHLKPWQVDRYVDEYDVDKSGKVEFEEFMAMMITLQSKKPRADSINYKEYLTETVINELRKEFREADDGNGLLDKKEVAKIFKSKGINFTDGQMDVIFEQVDEDGSGMVSFAEFCSLVVALTGTRKRINAHEFLDDDDYMALRKAFQTFDLDGGGSIDVEEIHGIFAMMGIAVDEQKQELLIQKYDADGSGVMEFDEFVEMMVDLRKLRKKRNINPTTIEAKQLRSLGFSAKDVKQLGFAPDLMRQDGYDAREMVAAKFSVDQLRHSGYKSEQMSNAGLGPSVLKRSGYSATDLRNQGYSNAALRANARYMNARPKDVPHYVTRRAQSAPRTGYHTTPRVRHFVDFEHKVVTKSKGSEMKAKFRNATSVIQRALKQLKAADVFSAAGGHERDYQEQRFQLLRGAQQIMISERAQREEALLEKQKQAVEQADAAVGNKPAPVRRKDRRRVSHAEVDIALGIDVTAVERPKTAGW